MYIGNQGMAPLANSEEANINVYPHVSCNYSKSVGPKLANRLQGILEVRNVS